MQYMHMHMRCKAPVNLLVTFVALMLCIVGTLRNELTMLCTSPSSIQTQRKRIEK